MIWVAMYSDARLRYFYTENVEGWGEKGIFIPIMLLSILQEGLLFFP